MKYPLYNPIAYALLSCTDSLLSLCFRKKYPPPPPPQRLLLCNGAHLGDLILTTSLLPPLKKAFPSLKIGMVVGSWCRPLVDPHPLIDTIHIVDHWKLNRQKKGRWGSYLSTRKRALQEILREQYDTAVDCYPHFPNMAPLLFQAKIPVRIGFESAGFSPLLTHALPWKKGNHSITEDMFSLLELFSEIKPHKQLLYPILNKPPSIEKKEYLLLHMGTGEQKKEWPIEKWRALTKKLVEQGYSLIFTGQGERENRAIQYVTEGLASTQNLCGVLSWDAFVLYIAQASLLIGMDSAAGHVAAACGTPSLLLYSGIHPLKRWSPPSPLAHMIVHPTPCSPCGRGCAHMSCVREIEVEEVYSQIQNLMSARPTTPLSSS